MITKAVLVFWVLIYFVVSAGLMALVNWVSMRPWRRAEEAHWTEQARLLWPVRFTARFSLVMIPLMLQQLHWILDPTFMADSNWLFLLYVGGVFGAIAGGYPLDRAIHAQVGFKSWFLTKLAIIGLGLGYWAAVVIAALLMPADFGWQMVAVTFGYIIGNALFLWGAMLKYLRLLGFLKPAGPRLHRIVESRVARLGNVRVRATWQLGGPMANAFAMTTTRELLFSDRLLEICDDDEVSAICDHELAHLGETKWVQLARIAGSYSMFPLIFVVPCFHHLGAFSPLYLFAITFTIARLVKILAQRMEKRADQRAQNEEANEGVYAKALEKLYRDNLSPAVNVNNRQAHPHLYDRMVAAGITPEYPRPRRAKRLTWAGWVLIVLAFLSFMMMAMVAPPPPPN